MTKVSDFCVRIVSFAGSPVTSMRCISCNVFPVGDAPNDFGVAMAERNIRRTAALRMAYWYLARDAAHRVWQLL